MATKIQIRRDTAANWTSANPTLSSGEQGFETDTGRMKIGDGSTAWNSLNYSLKGFVKTYNYSGNLAVNTGEVRFYVPVATSLSTVDAYVDTAPTGADVVLAILKNGTSVGTATISAGSVKVENVSINSTFAKGDYATVNITQVGSSTVGENLYVNFNFT